MMHWFNYNVIFMLFVLFDLLHAACAYERVVENQEL